MGQDDRRLAAIGLGSAISVVQGICIVAIHAEDMPAETFPFRIHRFHILDRHQGIDELQAIAIDNQTNIVQMVL
mgnify:FL=1